MSTTDYFSKENLLKCKGYISNFIDTKKSVSIASVLNFAHKKNLPKVDGTTTGILKYDNISVAYNSARKVPFYAAYNIDGNEKTSVIRKGNFRNDPRIKPEIQLPDSFYKFKLQGNKDIFEKGHMAAYKEMCWGNDAKEKAYRTFFYPNSSPQIESLNSGIWSRLETYIINETSDLDTNKKISVFTGPLLGENDPFYVNEPSFQIPLLFFKVVIFSFENLLYSTAFLMSHERKLSENNLLAIQDLDKIAAKIPSPFSDFKYKKVFQINLELLEEHSGLNFNWKNVKRIKIENNINQLKIIKTIRNVDDIPTDGLKNASSTKTNNSILNIILP